MHDPLSPIGNDVSYIDLGILAGYDRAPHIFCGVYNRRGTPREWKRKSPKKSLIGRIVGHCHDRARNATKPLWAGTAHIVLYIVSPLRPVSAGSTPGFPHWQAYTGHGKHWIFFFHIPTKQTDHRTYSDWPKKTTSSSSSSLPSKTILQRNTSNTTKFARGRSKEDTIDTACNVPPKGNEDG